MSFGSSVLPEFSNLATHVPIVRWFQSLLSCTRFFIIILYFITLTRSYCVFCVVPLKQDLYILSWLNWVLFCTMQKGQKSPKYVLLLLLTILAKAPCQYILPVRTGQCSTWQVLPYKVAPFPSGTNRHLTWNYVTATHILSTAFLMISLSQLIISVVIKRCFPIVIIYIPFIQN